MKQKSEPLSQGLPPGSSHDETLPLDYRVSESIKDILSSQKSIEAKAEALLPKFAYPYLYHYVGKNSDLADKIISFFSDIDGNMEEVHPNNPHEDLYRWSLILKHLVFILYSDEDCMTEISLISKWIDRTQAKLSTMTLQKYNHILINPNKNENYDIDIELFDSLEQLYAYLLQRCTALIRIFRRENQQIKERLEATLQELSLSGKTAGSEKTERKRKKLREDKSIFEQLIEDSIEESKEDEEREEIYRKAREIDERHKKRREEIRNAHRDK